MTELRLNIAADINRLHELACTKADEAIDHAKQAGLLLLEAKAAIPHGEWLGWLEQNVWVKPRRCQQYMQIAQGRPLPVRSLTSIDGANTQSIAHLEVDAPRLMPGEPDAAEFVPEAGYCYAFVTKNTSVYAVEPSLKHPGFWLVSKMDAATDMVVHTRRPVGPDWVETNLQYYGLEAPGKADWKMKKSAGVIEALDTFPGCAA